MNVAVGQNNEVRNEGLRIAGEKIYSDRVINVFNPYNGQLVGTVPKASQEDVRRAFSIAQSYKATLTRYERSNILKRAAE
ncbi:MAG TPA: aldehyde dehydrogenase family protein, partial [Pusillimonas sp.]